MLSPDRCQRGKDIIANKLALYGRGHDSNVDDRVQAARQRFDIVFVNVGNTQHIYQKSNQASACNLLDQNFAHLLSRVLGT